MGVTTWLKSIRTIRAIYPKRAGVRWARFSRGRGLAVVGWHRVSPWARGDARSALSMLVGAAGAPLMLFVLALPFGGAELVGRVAMAVLPADDAWLEVAMRAGDRLFARGEPAVALPAPGAPTAPAASAAAGTHGAPALTVRPAPVATPKPPAPTVTAARPLPPTRYVSQLEGRLHVPLAGVGVGIWRYRAPDGFTHLQVELQPEGGCQLQLVADLTRQVEAPRDGAGYALLDGFVANYMPAEAGATRAARLTWWRAALSERQVEAERRGQIDVGAVWNPTFNIGKRVGQAVLDGQAFSLVLYVPPEDPGL